MNTIETISNAPFRHLISTIGELPTSFTESMSYYEMLAWLCDFIEKKVVPVVDVNAEALKELQDYVVHYFDNLDVQEEINNKLDDMAESGELETIIAAYINANTLLSFDTVADMKLAENFVNGSYARTMGYYELNDGGSATYKIRTITNDDVVDEKFIIALADDTLVAELILFGKEVNVLCVGGHGENIAPVCNYLIPKGYHVYIPRGEYTATETILIGTNDTQFVCDGNITCDTSILLLFNVLSYRNIIKLNGTMIGYREDDVAVPDFMHIAGDNRSSNYNDIYVHRAHAFVNGFLLMPNGGNYGCGYNRIKFIHIEAIYGIRLKTGSTGANWINENTFTGGRLECIYGIVFEKGANQTDYYNGNRFYDIAIDRYDNGILYCIDIDWCLGNYFNELRLSEGLDDSGKYIRCGNHAYENHFSSEYIFRPSEFEDTASDTHYRNYYEIKLRTDDGDNFVANRFETSGGKIVVKYSDCVYIDKCYLNGYNKEDSTWTYTPEFWTDGMIVEVGNSSANKTITYNLPDIFNARGIKEFVLFVKARKATSTINIFQSNGSTAIVTNGQLSPGTEISGYGKLYLVRYTGRSGYETERYWQVIPMT